MENNFATAQAAQILGCHPASVRTLVLNCEIHPEHITARLLIFDRAEV